MACPLGKLTVNPPDPRINYNLLPGEELMTCPYNKSHAVLPIKFHRHVNNCRRLHIKAQREKAQPVLFSICQWDRSHHLPHALLAEHEATCKGRLDVADDWGEPLESVAGAACGSSGGGAAAAEGCSGGGDAAGSSGGGAAGGWTVKLQEPPQLTKEELEAIHTEDWEDEPAYPQFNQRKRIHELRLDGYALINTHDIVGLTKSEKKEFYAREEEDLRRYAKQALFRQMQEKAKASTTSNAFCTNTAASKSAGIAAAEAMAALSLSATGSAGTSTGTSASGSRSAKKGSSIYTIPEGAEGV